MWYLYKVSFVMQAGCPDMENHIREAIQGWLRDKSASDLAIDSVVVTQQEG